RTPATSPAPPRPSSAARTSHHRPLLARRPLDALLPPPPPARGAAAHRRHGCHRARPRPHPRRHRSRASALPRAQRRVRQRHPRGAGYVSALRAEGLRTGAPNADPGDRNDPTLAAEALTAVVAPRAQLAAALGAPPIVPAGRADHTPIVDRDSDLDRITENLGLISRPGAEHGVRLLVEVLPHRRYVHTVQDADALLARCAPEQSGVLVGVWHDDASAA